MTERFRRRVPTDALQIQIDKLYGAADGARKKRHKEGNVPPEKHWDQVAGEILGKEIGLFTYKTVEKFYHGIPDRYVAGGNWIEVKIIPAHKKAFVALKFFRPRQILINNTIHKRGDRAWVFVVWKMGGEEVRFTLMEWWKFRDHPTWTYEQVIENSRAEGPRQDLINLFRDKFGKEHARFSIYQAE